MPSASEVSRGPALAISDRMPEHNGSQTPGALCDAAQAFLMVNSPGQTQCYRNDCRQKSRQGVAVCASLPMELFAHSHAAHGERTPGPLVSIQLADDDGDDSSTPAKSGAAKSSLYRRVWGAGPSPILQRQIQRYSLRGKFSKNTGDRASTAGSPVSHGTPLAASLRPGHDTQPSDQSLRESAPPGASPFGSVAERPRTTYNDISSDDGNAVCGSGRAFKSPGLNSSGRAFKSTGLKSSSDSQAPAVATQTPEPRASASPAPDTVTRTPETRLCSSPALPATVGRVPPGRAGASPAPAAAIRTPETRIPRVAYLTPTAKGVTPGSALAYRTTASSPGPVPFTPPSSIRPSPNLGSGRKPMQHQLRGVAVLRHTAAASINGSAAWPGMSPARSDIVATPNPGMARTLDGLLQAEDIITALVARAVELAESGKHSSMQENNADTARPRRLFTLAVVSEADRVDAVSEGSDDTSPACRCTVM